MNKLGLNKIHFNVVAMSILITMFYILMTAFGEMSGPMSNLDNKISLSAGALTQYLLRTSVRFLIAIVFSTIIALIYAILAAKNTRIRVLLIPLLDVCQSIPVLGYLSFTVTAFVAIAPNNILGIEMAVIFAMITAQIWNIIFSLYQSFITVPAELYEVAKIYKLNKWQIFWKIELPFAMPGLISNIILSMSCSWFFIIAQEVISVGANSYTMPGMGAYISLALQNKDVNAIFLALAAILTVIMIFNEILFKPLISWSYQFRYEFNMGSGSKQNCWFLTYLQNSNLILCIFLPIRKLACAIYNIRLPKIISSQIKIISRFFEILWWLFIFWAFFDLINIIYGLCVNNLSIKDLMLTIKLGSYTGLRVMILLFISSLLWVPIGIYIGMRPKLVKYLQPITQLLTSIPANFYYPLFVIVITRFNLNPNIWLSAMIVIGSQWYILYNVIGGAQTIPTELLEAGAICKLSALDRNLKIILPAIAPFYVTGLITAAGGSWNASIISEVITWGNNTLIAKGLGSYIKIHTKSGDNARITLGVMVMVGFVLIINYLLWKPLYNYVSKRYRLE
jgi:NitT/TauT family transport system permease protein